MFKMGFVCRATLYVKSVPMKPLAVMQVPITADTVIALTEFFRGYPFMHGDRIVIREPAMAKLNELYGNDTAAYQILSSLTVDGLYEMDLNVTRFGD